MNPSAALHEAKTALRDDFKTYAYWLLTEGDVPDQLTAIAVDHEQRITLDFTVNQRRKLEDEG
jgi:hypothetical protein